MIIDCHGHYTTAPKELGEYRERQKAELAKDPRHQTVKGALNITDDQLRESVEGAQLKLQRERGSDVTIFSPRASGMGHHIGNDSTSRAWTEHCNDLIYRLTRLYPRNFVGVAQLPQSPGAPLDSSIRELERCVLELGFIGCNLNPDPTGGFFTGPALGDRYWYPLYEKLCDLDVPAHIHGTGSRSERSPYSVHFINEESIAVFGLVNSNVLNDFPTLKIVVSHGGGAIPYQLGRFEAPSLRRGTGGRFSDGLRKLYYDTVLYTEDALRLLIKTVGVDRCLFGTECPGVGSSVDPATSRSMDNVKPMIENIEWLSAADRKKIFEDNATAVFKLKVE